jgi:hypothetical protein
VGWNRGLIPRVLPGAISYHGATYFRQDGCHRRAGGRGGVARRGSWCWAGRTLTSAGGLGALSEYGLDRRAFNGYLLVGVGGCFAEYEANASGY